MTLRNILDRCAALGRAGGAMGARGLPDALIVGGAAAVAYGAGLIHAPAGFIVGGVLAMVGGVVAARRS